MWASVSGRADEFDFAERLEELNEELEALNLEAEQLAGADRGRRRCSLLAGGPMLKLAPDAAR